MRRLLLLGILLFSGCATPVYNDWECLNLWAELEVPKYCTYLAGDTKLSPFEVNARIAKAQRILIVTREYIQVQRTDTRGDFVARD
jgi:hypothetical protein